MPPVDLNTPAHALARALLSDPEKARDDLRGLGFRDPDRALRNLRGLVETDAAPPLPAPFLREVMDAPDPDRALNNFERLSQAVFGAELSSALNKRNLLSGEAAYFLKKSRVFRVSTV